MKTATAPRTSTYVLAIGTILLLLFGTAWAQSPLAGFDPGANGDVYATAVQADGKILVAGAFTMLGGGGTGTTTRNFIGRLNADGTLDSSFNPGANGTIYAMAVQADGKILVGGSFSMLGGGGTGTAARSFIGRLNSDGSLDTSFNPGANSTVYAFAIQSDGKILVGGNFTMLGGNARNYLARLNSDASGTLDNSFSPGADNTVVAIVAQADGSILLGGHFTTLAGSARNHIGKVFADGSLDTGFNPSADSAVLALVLQADGKIVAGGSFTTLGGTARNYIGRLNQDGSLDTGFNPGASSDVSTLLIQTDGAILVGGNFITLGGSSRNYLGRLQQDGTLDPSFNPGATNAVLALALESTGKILVGGSFTGLGGGLGITTRNQIGRLYQDGGLDQTVDLGISTGSNVAAIALQADGKVLIGGTFTTVLGQARTNLARINTDGSLDTTFAPNPNTSVDAIAVQPDGAIVVGGNFSTIGGQARSRIARLDSTGAVDSFNPSPNNTVTCLALQPDGKILVAGSFVTIGGQARNRLARLSSTTGLADSFNPNPNNVVSCIAVQPDGKILVGGGFTSIGGQTRNRMARLDGASGLADSLDPNGNNSILVIVLQPDGKILVGGNFNGTFGGQTRNRIARLDGTTGLADSFNPNSLSTVSSIALQADGKVLIGGAFTNVGGVVRNHIARLDAVTGAPDSFNPSTGAGGQVSAVVLQRDGKVVLGGSFTTVGATTRQAFAVLSNDIAAVADLTVSQASASWTLSGAAPQPALTSFESSNDNVNYSLPGAGTFGGGSWTLSGLSLPAGQNVYLRARGYYGDAYQSGSSSLIEFVRNAFFGVAPAITSANSTTFVVGTVGNFGVMKTGTPTPSLSESGALPSGVTFNSATGGLNGTPAALTGGVYPLTLIASNGIVPFATQSFTLTVNEAPNITSANRSTFTVGTPGSFTVTSTGYPPPTFSLSGSLPSGVTFNNATGLLSGTPAAGTGGVYSLSLTASNGIGSNSVQNFTLTVNEAPAITSANNATFTVGAAGSFTVTATGYPAPTIARSGTLPSGVTFNTTTHVLSGTPAANTGGSHPLTFTASNGVGSNAVQSFTLIVNQAPAITSANNTTFTVGSAGSFTVTRTGFPAPTVSESGALPSGVTFNTSTRVLSGTPAAGTGGTYSITFTASNGVGTNPVQNFTLTVNQASAITSADHATFGVGNAGTFTVTETGFPAPTLSETGTLPSGVTFNTTTGVLSGTPAAGTAGTYPITFTASNGVGSNAMQSFTLTVVPPPSPSQIVSRKSHGGTPFDVALPLTGTRGIECRSGGATNDYQLVFTFPSAVTFTNATVTTGAGSVANSGGSGTSTVTVNLTGITNVQTITVTVASVNDGTSRGDVAVQMGVLVGDTSGNGTVNATDVSQTKLQSGQALMNANFRNDINFNGTINASDVSSVKLKTGSALP
jgi:uncharacterized delta-60 repeat protein